MTTNSTWFKSEYKSLVRLLQEYRRVKKEFEKRNKGFKTVLIVEIVIFVVYLLLFIGLGMRNFSRATRNVTLIICLGVILLFLILDGFVWIFTVNKPKRDFLKKVKAQFPGIDLSSEESIKNYLWNFKDREFLSNLASLIVWEAGSREPTTYTEIEQVVLDVWRTNHIDHELYEYYFYGEEELTYLEGVINHFYTIGANEEATIWKETRELLSHIKKLDYEDHPELDDTTSIYSIDGMDGEARFLCKEEDRVWLNDLKQRHQMVREKTEKLLYKYVMEHFRKETFN